MKSTKSYETLLPEVTYKATRSGGKGGQNVNKVSTRIELFFDVVNSDILSEKEKTILLDKLSTKISEDGMLRITSSETRSQLENKENANKKFLAAIKKALTIPKVRKKTRIPTASKEERIKEKKKVSEKKKLREKV